MSLELLNTLASLATVAIVAATAVAALVQLRHMRGGNQINAMLNIGDKIQSRTHRDAEDIVNRGIKSGLEDASFREYVLALHRGDSVPDVDPRYVELRRAIILIGGTYEELGILVKNGIVDQTIFLDRYVHLIIRDWAALADYIAFGRDARGANSFWENFEYLTVLAQDWYERHRGASNYPAGIRRLQILNPWPIATAPTAS
jgi:hypothetical protein